MLGNKYTLADDPQVNSGDVVPDNKVPDCNACSRHNSFLSLAFKRTMVWAIFIIVICVIMVFIVLPPLFLLVGSIAPNIVKTTDVLEVFISNISFAVGFVSLLVGAFSIYYAVVSGKRMDEQIVEQRNILHSISEKEDKMDDRVRAQGNMLQEMCQNFTNTSAGSWHPRSESKEESLQS